MVVLTCWGRCLRGSTRISPGILSIAPFKCSSATMSIAGPIPAKFSTALLSERRSSEMVLLKGNHETCLLEFLRNPSMLQSWGQMGGFETLMSYGITPSLNADAQTQKKLASDFQAVLPKAHHDPA